MSILKYSLIYQVGLAIYFVSAAGYPISYINTPENRVEVMEVLVKSSVK